MSYYCGIKAAQKVAFKGAISEMVSQLADYPLWLNYIQTQFVNITYLGDGTFSGKSQGTANSYAHWATRQIETDARIKLLAAELVAQQAFPQQFEDKSVSEIVRGTGEKRDYRHYLLLKASEIIRP